MMDAKSRRAPGPKPFYMSSFLTDAKGALLTSFRLAPTVCVTCLPVGRLPAVNLGCIPGPTQRTSWRWRLAVGSTPKGQTALGAGQLIELFSPIHPGETFVPLTATLDAISGFLPVGTHSCFRPHAI